jgi:hypothetical protein
MLVNELLFSPPERKIFPYVAQMSNWLHLWAQNVPLCGSIELLVTPLSAECAYMWLNWITGYSPLRNVLDVAQWNTVCTLWKENVPLCGSIELLVPPLSAEGVPMWFNWVTGYVPDRRMCHFVAQLNDWIYPSKGRMCSYVAQLNYWWHPWAQNMSIWGSIELFATPLSTECEYKGLN